MTSEAAVLGVPALRLNDFVGRVSVIAELEQYGLAFGFRPGQESAVLEKLQELLSSPTTKQVFEARRKKMLNQMIDPAPWFAAQVMQLLESH